MTKKERQIVFDKYEGHCAYCGCELEKGWHVDHKEPLERNPFTGLERYQERKHIDNLMPSCASCNINKHSLPVESFRSLIKGFMKHLNEVNTQYKIAKRYGLVEETNNDVLFHFERIELYKAEDFEFGDFVVLKNMETHYWREWFEEPLMVQKVEKNPVDTNYLITVYCKNRQLKGIDSSRRFKDWELKKVNVDKSLGKYEKDLQQYEDSLYCTDCGNDKVDKTFIYSRTVANGEIWDCRECGKENMSNQKPNPDNY